MQQQLNPDVGRVRIYACGGFGVNIGSYFDGYKGQVEPGYSQIETAYVDTSRSNFNKANISPDRVFVLPDADGSGGYRAENHPEIAKNIPNILQQFKPLDFNIVVFSGAGGSGSVFGPLIVGELLRRGLPTICVVVGAEDSAKAAENTFRTLQSLEGIANSSKLPVVMYYRQNDNGENKRSNIDSDSQYVIGCISMLCSRQNAELDTKDIQNWVQFNKLTTAEARLARLMICNDENVSSIADPIAIASLLADPDDAGREIVPEYSCTGYPEAQGIHNRLPLHMVLTFEGLPAIIRRLQTRQAELETQRRARVRHDSILDGADVNPDGFVL
jgi:hypothetical protein